MRLPAAAILLAAALCRAATPFGAIDQDTPLHTAAEVDAAVSNLNVRTAPTGANTPDSHGCVHDGAVEIGVGARAAVEDISAAPSGTVVRSAAVAIGAGADATDPAQPWKRQSIAIGNDARAEGINSMAIGSGVRHADEDDMGGGNAYALGAQAIAIGYAAKATATNAVQIGTGTNATPNSIAFMGTPIVTNGVLAVPPIDPEPIVQETLGRRAAILTQTRTDATNSVAAVRLDAYDAATDTDHGLVISVDTNESAAAATIRYGDGPRLDIYKAATVDRLLAEMSNALASAISAGGPEWAQPTWDSIRVERLPIGPSSVLAPYRDAMRRHTSSGGAVLSAFRSIRPADPSETIRDEPLDGAWALIGSPDCAVLSSNVLYETAHPGAATVEFTPADGSPALRATVAMGGGATNYATVAWPAGEVEGSWRRARGEELADLVANAITGGGGAAIVSTNYWNGTTWICTNRAGLAIAEFLGAEGVRAFALPASGAGGGLLALAPHYGVSALHTGPGPGTLRFLDEARTVLPRGWTKVDSRGDCALWRLDNAVPTNLCARLLRESVLARKSASRLFRFPGMHLNQHGYLSPVLLAPSASADLSGATWASVVYAGSGTHLRTTWDGCDWAGLLHPLSHDMHAGDSGLPVWFFLTDRAVPVYLAHTNAGANYTLLDDALLDWLDASIIDDSGGAERISFLRESDL